MINTIIFDAEGVVIDTETIWDSGQEEFLRRRSCVYDRGKVKPLLTGRSVIEGVQVMQELYNFGGNPETLAKERISIIEDLLRHKVKFIPGFNNFFKRISSTHKTCIATAMDEHLFKIIDKVLDLSNIFKNNIFMIRDVNYISKPNPDLFLYAAEKLQSSPSNCMVIEDSPLGIQAAHNAHMRCTAITTTYSMDLLSSADIVVSSFSEIETDAWQAM